MTRTLQFLGIAALAVAFQLPAFAKCPISDGTTVIVRAPVGNLRVDTTGRDAVDITVTTDLAVKENCGRDRIEYTADAPGQFRGTIDWKILVPRTVNLDLVTYGGNITVGDSDGAVKLRTTGGSVTVGRIKGKTAIISQAGFIKTGDLGDDAEMRISSAGAIEIGSVAGNADLHTAGGPITTGFVNGKVTAEASGGSIYIKGAHGEVAVDAEPGDIYVGDAARINAKSAGGSITNPRVRGPFHGETESGNIRLDQAGSWVEATTGYGSIVVRMVPESFDGDLHMNLQSGVGDVTIYIPERMRATIDATVERPAMNARRIISEFPMNGLASNAPVPNRRGTRAIPAVTPPPSVNRFLSPVHEQGVIQGGGNQIQLHTSLGKIEIFKIRM